LYFRTLGKERELRWYNTEQTTMDDGEKWRKKKTTMRRERERSEEAHVVRRRVVALVRLLLQHLLLELRPDLAEQDQKRVDRILHGDDGGLAAICLHLELDARLEGMGNTVAGEKDAFLKEELAVGAEER
jgi:hypothetical protein